MYQHHHGREQLRRVRRGLRERNGLREQRVLRALHRPPRPVRHHLCGHQLEFHELWSVRARLFRGADLCVGHVHLCGPVGGLRERVLQPHVGQCQLWALWQRVRIGKLLCRERVCGMQRPADIVFGWCVHGHEPGPCALRYV